MKSEEGVIWCWKMNSSNILFIFRENDQEIEVDLAYVTVMFLRNNSLLLLEVEKQFLINLKEEINEKI